MDQGALTGLFCSRPQNFAWFLGAGASRSAGLPTATDILWLMKRRYYCQEENQDIARQDIQNPAIRTRIKSYMESRGFPSEGADEEYGVYFEKIFGDDKQRQRQYIKKVLAEDKVTLNVGNRVLGAMMAAGTVRSVFTTNFDTVVEKAVAETSGQSIAAYHLEGSASAVDALNNEEFPIYCKLHGDFRYDSLKNLPGDLKEQNADLAKCLVNAANRFGLIVAGYSGRDASIIKLLRDALGSPNPFPHGLYWTGLKGAQPALPVASLLEAARGNGVQAEYVEIETYDALMLRLWRNLEGRPEELDKKVRKTEFAKAAISLPPPGRANSIIRMNALPVLSSPSKCQELRFREPKTTWKDLRAGQKRVPGAIILTKSEKIFCWGREADIKRAFPEGLLSIGEADLPEDFAAPNNLPIKGLVEEALCKALARGKPLVSRSTRTNTFLIANALDNDQSALQPLLDIAGSIAGNVPGVFTPVTDFHPQSEQVRWSEAVQVSLDVRDGRFWVLLTPDIWIWPQRARRNATEFLDRRRGDRFNAKFNSLLDAWAKLILATDQRNVEIAVSTLEDGTEAENPKFVLSSRTGFTKRIAS